MVSLKCNKCGKEFNRTYNYNRHINRIKPCSKDVEKNTPDKSNKGCEFINNTPVQSKFSKKKEKNIQKTDNKILTPTIKKTKKNNKGITYKCSSCNESFGTKYTLNRHIVNRCTIKKSTSEKTMNTCKYCNRAFSNKYILKRHINYRCKVIKSIYRNKEELYQKLLSKMKTMEEQNKKLTNKLIVITNMDNSININNNKNSNNTINNINLVVFGNEDMESIGIDQIKKILNKGFMSVPQLTSEIHFNKNLPQFHNVYISNNRDKYAMVFNGSNWNLQEKQPIIDQLIEDKQDFLLEKYEELKDELPESTIRKFDRYIEQHMDNEVIEQNKKNIQLILYNCRDIPLKTKNLK